MRNLFHIVLVISLLVSTAGFAVTKHFCGKMLASVSVGTEAKSCCDPGSMPADCDCHSDTDHVSVEDDFQLDQQVVKFTPQLQFVLVSFINELRLALLLDEPSRKLLFHSQQPPVAECDIYIRVQSFLI
ncbi:HYC_CC_PP family protein [Pontibacter rugosus]